MYESQKDLSYCPSLFTAIKNRKCLLEIYMHKECMQVNESLLDVVLICPIKVLYNFEISLEYVLS